MTRLRKVIGIVKLVASPRRASKAPASLDAVFEVQIVQFRRLFEVIKRLPARFMRRQRLLELLDAIDRAETKAVPGLDSARQLRVDISDALREGLAPSNLHLERKPAGGIVVVRETPGNPGANARMPTADISKCSGDDPSRDAIQPENGEAGSLRIPLLVPL